MADVPGKFYRATKVRTGVSPSSPGAIEGEVTPPLNPPGGGLNSVGLTMPSAFNVANSPLTANGTIGVTGAGTVGQYIRGDGSLADFPQTSGGGSSVSYYLNGSVNQGTIGGVAYRELNKVPVLGTGTDFSINADGYIASFITDAGDPSLLEIPGGNWNFETYFSASSSGGTPTFYVELYKYNGTTFTLLASNSGSPEFIAFGTTLTSYFSTLAVPTTTLALTDRLAIRYYVNHSGRTITLHTEDNHLCQVITTFTTGLTALNGLTAQVQNFAVGTSGSDFNIASATATHTFNLPTASATNRGALSSADWSTFNAKQNALTLTTTGTSGAATLVGATLNIPQYQAALINPVTGTGSTGQVAYWSSGSAITGESELFWDATNNRLGIGITPTATLQVRGPNALGAFFNAQNEGAAGALFERIGNTFPFNRYTFSNGVIGINTPSPSGALHIVNPSGASQPVLELQQQNSGSNIVQWRGSAGTYLGIIADNGNVGIGTVEPTSSFNARLAVRNEDAANNPTLVLFKNINSASSEDIFRVQSWNGAFNTVASIRANGSANFSGSITASSIIRSGGTSSQYLMADGSVSTLSNPVTGTGTTNYLPKFTGSTTIGNSIVQDNGVGYAVGIGVTTSSWFLGGLNAIQIQNGGIYGYSTSEVGITANAFYNASLGGWRYISNGVSTFYQQTGGSHSWHNAPSGTAGNAISFTQAMTLFATGNLLVGSPSPISDNGARLQVSGTAIFTGGGTYRLTINGTSTNTGLLLRESSTDKWALASASNSFLIYNEQNASSALTINSSNAATFSSSVTAGGPGTFQGVNDGTAIFARRTGGANVFALNVNLDSSWTMFDHAAGSYTAGITQKNGNVGIGTPSPAAKLLVNLTTNENIALGSLSAIPTGRTLILQTNSNGGQIETYSSISSSYVNTLINPNGGNVLIGTTTDNGARLQVEHNGNSPLLISTSSTTLFTTYRSNSVVVGYIGNGDGIVSSGGATNFGIRAENDLIFTSGGNNRRLTISSTGAATFSSSVTAAGGFEIPNGQFYRARRTSGNLLTDMIGIPSGTNDVRVVTTGAFQVISGGLTTFLNISDTGSATFSSLAGSGNRIVVANSGGTLISAVIGSGLAFDGTTLTATGGGSGSISGSGTSGFMPVFTGATSIGNSIVQANASRITVVSNTDGQLIEMARSGGAYYWKLGIDGSSRYVLYNNSNTSMFEMDPNNANTTFGSGQNVTLRLGRNVSDWGEVQYSGGVTSLINGWANTSAYIQQSVNGQWTRLFGSGILDQNRTSEGTHYRLQVNGNNRMILGTDGSANAIIRTGNNVDLRLGVNEDAITIKNGGNVLIGTATDNGAKLNVNGGATLNGNLRIIASNGFNDSINLNRTYSNAMILNSSGNLILNGTTGSSRLTCYGDGYFSSNLETGGDILVRGSYNPYASTNRGNITLNGTSSNILAFTNNSAGRGYILHDGTDIEITNLASGQLQFFVASGEAFRVLSGRSILTYADLAVGGKINGFDLTTLAPTGTNNIEWRLGRALLATSADPEDRWIRVQLGNRIYDILAIDRGLA